MYYPINEELARRAKESYSHFDYDEGEVGTNDAINACYRHPWRFYRTHSAEQAIEIILNENGRKKQ